MIKKKIFLLIFMIVGMFFSISTVSAAEETKSCTTTQLNELRQLAASIKVSYIPQTLFEKLDYTDVETGATMSTRRYLDIKMYNLNTRLYVEATSDDGLNKIFTTDDLADDGTLTLRQPALGKKVNYTFAIKSSKYGCEKEILRTIRLTLPMFNAYSQLDVCAEIPDYYLCQEYVTRPVDDSTFYESVDKYKSKLLSHGKEDDENNTGVVNRVFSNASKYKYVIVGIIVALGVVVTIVVVKKKETTL